MSSFKEKLDNANKYSAEEFIKLISESDNFCKLGSRDKQIIVKGNVAFTNKNYSKNHLKLINVVFEGLFSFSSLHLHSGLVFQNCEFKGPVSLEDCNSSKEIEGKSALENYSLAFSGCKISSLFIGVSTFENGILIQGSEFEKSEIGKISFQDVNINASFSLSHCHLSSSFGFFGGIVKSMGIHFTSVQIDKSVRISPKVCSNLYFEGKDSIYKDFLHISGTKYDSIIFNTGTFKDEVTIQDNSISEFLSFLGAEFESEVNVTFDKSNMDTFYVKDIHILDTKFKNGIQFSGSGITSEKIQVYFSEKSSGVIDFRNTFFKEVVLKGNNFNNSFFLRDCSYDKLTITHFFNKALISFNNNNPQISDGEPIEILIQNSNLGNTEFYDFDFSIYPTIKIIDSRVDNIFVNGGRWFETNQLQFPESKKDQGKILSQKREIYRQLKLASEKQSDRITALEFKAKEVETHRLFLELGNVKKADRWAILAGTTNNHGQNWVLPLILILIGTTFPFYPLIFMAADPEISLWCLECDFISLKTFREKFWNYGSAWPSLFNPARRLNDLFPELKIESSFALGFWDGFHRILLAFFIFQIVSAFRKFVK